MNAQGVASIPSEKAAHSSLNKFKLALQSVEPSKRQRREEALIEAYDTIQQHAQRKVPWKVIVAKFNEAYGLSMHPARLRKEFEEERKRREDVYGVAEFERIKEEEVDIPERASGETDA